MTALSKYLDINKADNPQLNCTYQHDFNIFNMKHLVDGDLKAKKKKIHFKMDFSSSLLNIFDFNQMDFKICHKSKMDKKVVQKNIAKEMIKHFKKIKVGDIKKEQKGDQICYVVRKGVEKQEKKPSQKRSRKLSHVNSHHRRIISRSFLKNRRKQSREKWLEGKRKKII